MYRKFGIGILILCFSLSSVNLGLAYDVIEVSPVVVQPYEVGPMNEQMYQVDRENQEKVVEIQALAKENQKLADAAAAQKQKTTLAQVNNTITRSQMVSKYDELINLTEDVDNMKGFGNTVWQKRDVILEKYKILTDLENEMMALNKKLSHEPAPVDLGTLGEQQSDKIQLLTQRLGEMDQRIVHYNDVLSNKDQQIAQLVDNLARVQNESKTKDDLIKEQKNQVDLLKSELENKITEANNQTSKDAIIRQHENQITDLKTTIQNQALDLKVKTDSIHWLNQVLTVTKNEAKYYKLTSEQDQAIIQKIQKELKDLRMDFAQHSKDYDHFENTIDTYRSQVSELGQQVSQKQSQVDLLKLELKNKIAEGKDQGVLADQIQDLKSQLQDKEDQIASMKNRIQSGQGTKPDTDTFRQQLAILQDKVDQLKQQLDIKTAQADQMSLIVDEYQRKMEAKNNAYNEQLAQVMSAKNDQVQLEKQVVDLSARLQDKEAQIVTIKKNLYDLQESSRSSQATDLNGSLAQQKEMQKKIDADKVELNGLQTLSDAQAKEVARLKSKLALERQGLNGISNSDELNFLRTAYKQASADLELKDKMFHETQANFVEYEKAFREQTKEFHSLKDQLQQAQQELKAKDEDLRYKGLEIIRLKELAQTNEEGLKAQVRALTRKLEAADKSFIGNPHENNVKVLQEQLERENEEIKDLQKQLDQFKNPINHDALVDKLTQALSKIDQQGKAINLLAQKLQECGQSVDLSKTPSTSTPGVQKLF